MRLVITVTFHEGRYHGADDWPPSPARLFQALIAGTGLAGPLHESEKAALRWLEGLGAPMIASPRSEEGQSVQYFVPRNDRDLGGLDPAAVADVRMAKVTQPRLFGARVPLVYAWHVGDDEAQRPHAQQVVELAENLYQLGQGFDMAWARAEVLDEVAFEARLWEHPGEIHHPTPRASGGATLLAPTRGSLDSLEARHLARSGQLRVDGRRHVLSRAPRPTFDPVAYDAPPTQRLFELRPLEGFARFAAWRLTEVASLIGELRRAAAQRLRGELEGTGTEIVAAFDARPGGGDAPIRILPIPSVYPDLVIRRVLVEVAPNCGLSADDVVWAFTGIVLHDRMALVAAEDVTILRKQYGIGSAHHEWQTLTPVVLATAHGRAGRMSGEARVALELGVAKEACRALREAGVRSRIERVRVQREPFVQNGQRAESFAQDSGIHADRLWHVRVRFRDPVKGPVTFGAGRTRGLGVMAPVPS